MQKSDVGAEQSFCTAIRIAQNQSAKSLELAATTSLARLLSDAGRRDEARTMLAEIYNWFTEGFDTADLKDAKALLDELAVWSEAYCAVQNAALIIGKPRGSVTAAVRRYNLNAPRAER